MNFSTTIDFLLENANPSIKRRIKDEILHNLTPGEAAHYQEQIMQEPIVQQVAACQNENGWIGTSLHGNIETQEGGTKFLAEKALNKDTPVLKRAMDAFVTVPLDDWCYDTKGRIFDEFKVTGHGMNLIRCACIARAGYDDVIDISPQIQLSLDCFKRVLEVDSVLDISRPIKNGKQRVFNDYEKWPCRYHLDILAHTTTWKNEEHIKMLADSVTKMMKTDRPELVNYSPSSWVGYALGPLGGFPSQGLTVKVTCGLPSPINIHLPNKPEVYQLEYLEWFARCGVIKNVPALQDAVRDILDFADNDGICRAPVLEGKDWGPYYGMKLEVDWKSGTRRDCDITFRVLLIAYYAGYMNGGKIN